MRREPSDPPPREDPVWDLVRCARCGDSFRCGARASACWCDAVELTPERRAGLAELRLEGCLCRRCLETL